MIEELTELEKNAVNIIRKRQIQPYEGLPEELFLMVSALVPLPNVDLLIINNRNQILLTRRNDPFFESSWHIPGGTMRFGESFENRIHETAIHELKSDVEIMGTDPIAVRNVIRGKNIKLKYPNERGHNVAMLFRCRLPQNYVIDNGMLCEQDAGYIKWFEHIPQDIMSIQHVYDDVLKSWM